MIIIAWPCIITFLASTYLFSCRWINFNNISFFSLKFYVPCNFFVILKYRKIYRYYFRLNIIHAKHRDNRFYLWLFRIHAKKNLSINKRCLYLLNDCFKNYTYFILYFVAIELIPLCFPNSSIHFMVTFEWNICVSRNYMIYEGYLSGRRPSQKKYPFSLDSPIWDAAFCNFKVELNILCSKA